MTIDIVSTRSIEAAGLAELKTVRLQIESASSHPLSDESRPPGARYARVTNGLFAVFILLITGVITGRTEADPDLWGHLRFGHEIIRTFAIARADQYSFTADREWINHEWLAEVITSAAYDWFGTSGLLALTTGITLGVLFLLWRLLRDVGVRVPVRAGLLVLALAGISSQLTTIRPQIFSVLLFAALVSVLVRSENGNPRALLAVPVVFAFWSNLHGGWIVGLGSLWLWSLTAAVRRQVALPWLFWTAISGTLATLVNPYGFGLWSFLWQTVGLGRAEIEDWQPLVFFPRRLIPWIATTGFVLWAWRCNVGRVFRPGVTRNAASFVPVVALALLSLKVVRLDAFYTLLAVTLLSRYVAGYGPSWFPLSKKPTGNEIAVVGAAAAVALTTVVYGAGNTARCLPLMQTGPEPEAAQFIASNRLTGKLLTWFGYGEYAIWHFWPNLRVSYDGRRETTYSDGVRLAHLAFYFGNDPSYARQLNADYIWLKNSLPIVPALEADGWLPIFRGPRSVILTRSSEEYRQPEAFSGSRCFPGP